MSTINTFTTGRQAAFPDGEIPSLSEPRFAPAGFADDDGPVDVGSSEPQVIELEPGELSTTEEFHLFEALTASKRRIKTELDARHGGGNAIVRMEVMDSTFRRAPMTEYYVTVIPIGAVGTFTKQGQTLTEATDAAMAELDLRQRQAAFAAALEADCETDTRKAGVTL